MIGFIGAGNMATALMKGIQGDLIASDKYAPALKNVESLAETTGNNKEVVEKSNIVFLAVKPQDLDEILEEIKEAVNDQIIISIAAGVTISRMKNTLGDKKIVRVMPNTPALVGEMAAGFSCTNLSQEEEIMIEELLNMCGPSFKMEERLLDAVTGLSGSGPAFIARLIESFADAGKEQGLDEKVAYELALQTFKGTAKLLQESQMKPEELVKMVSSPGGTTIAGREVLENSDYKEIIKETIKKATKKSKELGNASKH